MKGYSPCGWQTALSEYRSIFYPTKILLESNGFAQYLPWLCFKDPWKFHAVTWCGYFLEFFAIKAFLTEWLCLGHFRFGRQIAFCEYR